MRTKDSIIEEIIQFFKDNKSVFTTAIEELDDCNENGLFAGKEPVDILRCGFDGYDADTWSLDSGGNKKYGAFNPHSNYFYFDRCYGSLVSCDSPDYFNQLDESAVESLCENRRHIPTIRKNADLEQLFNELEAFD